ELPLLQDRAIDAQRAKLLQANLKLEANRLALDAQALATARDAAIAYWVWVGSGQKLLIAIRLMRLAEQRERAIEALIASGAIPGAERLENRRVLLARRQEVLKAVRKLEKASIKLALYLRDDNGDPVLPDPRTLPNTLEAPQPIGEALLERARAIAMEQRPEVDQMQANMQIAEIEVELSENQVNPELDLMASTSWDLGNTPADLDKKLGPPVVEWGLSLKVPLQMRKPRGQRDAARARRVGIAFDNQLAADTLLNQVDDAISALRTAQSVVPVARDGAQMANLRAEAERRRFIAGSTDLFKVNLLEDYAAQSEAKLVDALADLNAAHAILKTVLGYSPLDDL
ncbi:MAG: TolC family protein, partial [Myxococcota bacterium]